MVTKNNILTAGVALCCLGLVACGGDSSSAPVPVEGSFDNGTSNSWIATGLWHVSTARSSNGANSMWYGDDITGNYDTGVTNSGTISSNDIALGVAPSISFDYFLDNECTAAGAGTVCTNDKLIAQISTNSGRSWTDLEDLGVSSLGFTSKFFDLTAYASATVLVRFSFDTINSTNNAFEGAYVDNIVLTDAEHVPGIIVTPPSTITTLEAIPTVVRNVSIVLATQPSADVSISLSSDTLTEGDIQGSATVTFNATNWSIPQAVGIVGVDDAIADGNTAYSIVTAPAVSSDPLYDSLDPSDVSMTNLDDDAVATACAGAITLGDDDFAERALGFSFPFAGSNWNSVFVGSNGFLTFGVGSSNLSESVSSMINDYPRIAALFDDLNPSSGGTVSCSSTATSATFSFVSVPEWSNSGANTFDITLHDTGVIDIVYGAISAPDGLAGISYGNIVEGITDPGEIDLSVNPVQTIAPLVYEISPNDLSGVTLTFNP